MPSAGNIWFNVFFVLDGCNYEKKLRKNFPSRATEFYLCHGFSSFTVSFFFLAKRITNDSILGLSKSDRHRSSFTFSSIQMHKNIIKRKIRIVHVLFTHLFVRISISTLFHSNLILFLMLDPQNLTAIFLFHIPKSHQHCSNRNGSGVNYTLKQALRIQMILCFSSGFIVLFSMHFLCHKTKRQKGKWWFIFAFVNAFFHGCSRYAFDGDYILLVQCYFRNRYFRISITCFSKPKIRILIMVNFRSHVFYDNIF